MRGDTRGIKLNEYTYLREEIFLFFPQEAGNLRRKGRPLADCRSEWWSRTKSEPRMKVWWIWRRPLCRSFRQRSSLRLFWALTRNAAPDEGALNCKLFYIVISVNYYEFVYIYTILFNLLIYSNDLSVLLISNTWRFRIEYFNFYRIPNTSFTSRISFFLKQIY